MKNRLMTLQAHLIEFFNSLKTALTELMKRFFSFFHSQKTESIFIHPRSILWSMQGLSCLNSKNSPLKENIKKEYNFTAEIPHETVTSRHCG